MGSEVIVFNVSWAFFQSGLTAHPALGRRPPSKCVLSSTYRSYPRGSWTFYTSVGNLECLEIQDVWGLTRVSVFQGTRTERCRCLAVCGKENTGHRQSADGGFDTPAERALSCPFISGPVLLFSITSKGMKKHAAEFLLVPPSSPALSLLSCAGPCQEQGWGALAAGLIQPDPQCCFSSQCCGDSAFCCCAGSPCSLVL